jgi:hypothetical protein
MDYQLVQAVILTAASFLFLASGLSWCGLYFILRGNWRVGMPQWLCIWLAVVCFAFIPTVIGAVMHSENDRFVLGVLLFGPLAWSYPAGIVLSLLLAKFVKHKSTRLHIPAKKVLLLSIAGLALASVCWIIVFRSWGFKKPSFEPYTGPTFPTPVRIEEDH